MSADLSALISVDTAEWHTVLPEAEDICIRAALIAWRVGLGGGAIMPNGIPEVSIVLSDDNAVRVLNQNYRGQNKPTNVLSFAALEDDDMLMNAQGHTLYLAGDVIIALETTQKEAKEEHKLLSSHLSHLVVHGVLHLMGFDHNEDDEAETMEELERKALAVLGINDPYAGQ